MSETRTTGRVPFRYREVSEENRSILDGLKTFDARKEYTDYLREAEWTVVTPRPVEYATFAEVIANDPEMRAYLEREDDPVLAAELLCRRYPHIFYSIDHVYQIFTDWKIKWTKKGGHTGGGKMEPLTLPDKCLASLSDREIDATSRRWFRKMIRQLNRDPEGTRRGLEEEFRAQKDRKKKAFCAHLLRISDDLLQMTFPEFVDEIDSGKPFPSMHVRLWIQEILERKNALIVGDVGTQKTSAAVVGLEKLGRRAVVVCCRSYAKDMWAQEIRKYYRAPMDPLVIQSAEDIVALERMTPEQFRKRRFIIVGYGNIQVGHCGPLNGDEDEDDDPPKAWRRATRKPKKVDWLDVERKGRSYGERLVEALIRLNPDGVVIDEAHAIKSNGTRSQRIMRIARAKSVRNRILLTATPYENRPNEVANLASLLSPKEYPTPQHFLVSCRDNPRLFFREMAKRMCDYFSQEDVLDLPPTNLTIHGFFPTIELECPRDIARVLDVIRNDGTMEARLQVTRMTRFLSAPATTRNRYRSLRNLPCFTDPMANPKLAYLKEAVAERIKTGKVVIASGIYAGGITRGCDEVDDVMRIASVFEQWFPGQVLVLDGASPSKGPGSRKDIQKRWRNDENAKILIASVPASSESLNFTLRKIPGSVEKVTIYYVSLPWKPTQYLQFNGRFRRPGSEVPLEVYTLIVKGTSDEALLELNERKWRNFLIGVHGMQLQTEEEDAINKSVFAKIITTPGQWLREVFMNMLGMGEERLEGFLAKEFRDLPVAETLARYYLATEDYGTSGHISRVTAPTICLWQKSGVIPSFDDVLDIGCGPLTLERKLDAPIHAIEINPMMLDVGRAVSTHKGANVIVGRASAMPPEWTGRFSFALASIVLDLTSKKAFSGKGRGREIERVRVLRECHRVLKPDGLLWLTFQDRCFREDESFEVFTKALETFGFEPVDPWTNRIRALDHTEHRFAFWSVLVRKVRDPAEKPECPLFGHERPVDRVVRVKPKKPFIKPPSPEPELYKHERFAICPRNGTVVPIAMAAARVTSAEQHAGLLFEAIVKRFGIAGSSAFAADLRKLILRHKPRSTGDPKEIWRSVRESPEAPRIKWADLSLAARPHLVVS